MPEPDFQALHDQQLRAAVEDSDREHLEWLERHTKRLEGDLMRLEGENARLKAIESSWLWRATRPLERRAAQLPAPVRRRIRRTLEGVRLLVTFRFVSRLRHRGPGVPSPAVAPPDTAVALDSAQGFPHLQPLRVFRAPSTVPTVNVVTDSLHPGSLFGGVATTIILASRLAERVGGRIRVVTRTQESDAADVARVLRYYQVPDDFEIETVLAGPRNDSSVPLGEREYFLTTAWWTAAPTVSAVGYRRVVHMLQEDERIFYPLGDEYVRCAETLADPRLRVAVNSEILFRHLTGGAQPLPDLSSRAVVFEPAFPEQLFYDDQEARDASGRRNFFFYARPHNVRNLFWRGLEAIERALIEGVLDPAEWRFFFVGKDLQPIYHLPGGPEVVVAQNLSLPAYAELARQAHVGLNLIYSPHPSYPPLDLAASGAVVVTNRFDDTKLDLSSYSKNILCVGTSVNELTEGISAAVALAANEEKRLKHVADSGIRRDWCATLAPVVEQVLEWCDG